MKQQELQTQQSLIQYQIDFGTLNYLSGLFDTSYTELAEPALAPNRRIELRNNWLFRQFQIDSLKLKISEEQINFNYKPKISWTFDAGFNSSLTPEWYKNFGLSAGLSFSLPLFDWGVRDLERQKLMIEEQTRRHNREFFLKQFNQQTSMLMQQLQTTEELINLTIEQAKYSRALIEANKRLLVTGDVRVVDFITSINDYMNIRKLIRQNVVSKYLIINQINYWNGYQ